MDEKTTPGQIGIPEAVKLQTELTQLMCKMVASLGLDRAVKMLRATLATFKV